MDILQNLSPEQSEASEKLTPQELVFCNLWLTSAGHGMSRGKCYLEAGLQARSVSAASGAASRLLRKPEIAEYCALMRGESSRMAGLTLAYLDMQLKNIIDCSVSDVLSSISTEIGTDHETGEILYGHTPILRCAIDELPPEVQASIVSIKNTKDGVEVKLHSKLDAIRLAYQRQGALTDRREFTGPDGKPLQLLPDDQLDKKIEKLLREYSTDK